MTEQKEFGDRLDEYIKDLGKEAEGLLISAENRRLQAEYLLKQRELFEKYGARVPIAMQATQFIIEQIAAASSSPSLENPPETKVVGKVPIPRPRIRPTTPSGSEADQIRYYNIAPQVKPIMNGIFGRGKEEIPEDLNGLFDRMYGQDWHSRSIGIPSRPGLPRVARTYLEDLHSPGSYIRRLIKGTDNVINRNMRGNTPPTFPFRGKVAAVELVQLYNKIDAIGWDVYEDFMVRNGIRQARA